jgi:periplasmic divalent cation tolerance protein
MVLALTTEADQTRGEQLALAVLEAGVAACVSLRPVQSLYHWQGELERSQEVELLFKTSPQRLEALRELVHRRHSYRTPEWIWWSAAASPGYGAWVQDSCSG